MDTTETRAGFAALIGRPNVGKSTLLNALLGQKVAIVSPRAQTTRNRVLGIKTLGAAQLALLDTPGIHRGSHPLNRYMVREALDASSGVDCLVVVTEVQSAARAGASGSPDGGLHPGDRFALEQARSQAPQAPMVIAINKIDRLRDRATLLPLIDSWSRVQQSSIVPISALHGEGLDALEQEIAQRMPPGPHLFAEDALTDQAERFIAAELIREQVFVQCRQEIPYSTAVEIEEFVERRDETSPAGELKDVSIAATVFVEREAQKPIVIGKRAARIKAIGQAARAAIAELLQCPVHLHLTVRVAEKWTRTSRLRRRFGYE